MWKQFEQIKLLVSLHTWALCCKLPHNILWVWPTLTFNSSLLISLRQFPSSILWLNRSSSQAKICWLLHTGKMVYHTELATGLMIQIQGYILDVFLTFPTSHIEINVIVLLRVPCHFLPSTPSPLPHLFNSLHNIYPCPDLSIPYFLEEKKSDLRLHSIHNYHLI